MSLAPGRAIVSGPGTEIHGKIMQFGMYFLDFGEFRGVRPCRALEGFRAHCAQWALCAKHEDVRCDLGLGPLASPVPYTSGPVPYTFRF